MPLLGAQWVLQLSLYQQSYEEQLLEAGHF